MAALSGTWAALPAKRFEVGRELPAGQWVRITVTRGLHEDAPSCC
jgi:hypothetical protein